MTRTDTRNSKEAQRAFRLVIGIVIGVAICLAMQWPAAAADLANSFSGRFTAVISVPVGSNVELPVRNIKRVTVGAPNMLSAARSATGLTLTGLKVGDTILAVKTSAGLKSYYIQVVAQVTEPEPAPEAKAEYPVAADTGARAESRDADPCTAVVSVPVGSSVDLPIEGIKRVTIGAPNMLSAARSATGLTLAGKKAGNTILAVKTSAGLKSYRIQVVAQVAAADPAPAAMTKTSAPARATPASTIALIEKDIVLTAPVRVVKAAAPTAKAKAPAAPIPILLEPGESSLLKGVSITRVSVSDPNVVNIVPVSPTETLLNAIKEGKATARVWDAAGLATYDVTVAKKTPSPEEIAAAIVSQIGIPTISARVTGDTVALSGVAPTRDVADKAGSVAEASGKKVLNLITVESVSAEVVIASLKAALPREPLTYEMLPDRTVMITGTVATQEDAFRIRQVIEAWLGTPEVAAGDRGNARAQVSFVGRETTPADVTDRAVTRAATSQSEPGTAEVSEEFNVTRQVFGGRMADGPRIVAIIEVNPALSKQVLVSVQVVEVDRSKLKRLGIQWSEILGASATSPLIVSEARNATGETYRLNEGGPIVRSALSSSIKALVTDNAARILSEPKVLITDGHAAHILVGGEIPIPIAQNSSIGTASISVLFKPFGIQLTVRPKITPDNRILLTLTPEVSDLDFTNAVRASGIEIPALTVRRATTTVHVANGESLAIGGLLSSKDTKIVERVPLLSKIPILGELFKSKSFRNDQTELIIIVTPRIVEQGAVVPIVSP